MLTETSTGDERERLARVLTPAAPPRVLEHVYTDDQYERLLDVVKRRRAVADDQRAPLRHRSTNSSRPRRASVPKDHGLTLDDIATAHFRGFYGQNSVCFYPEIHDCFYNDTFIEAVKVYWGARVRQADDDAVQHLRPAPRAGSTPHLDAVTFRGVRYENTPVWLQNIMAKSGLFTDYIVKMAQVITWWYRGEDGTFTYWPDGPLQPPKELEHPLWNKGVVVQNELMFHRGDPVGAPDERAIAGLKHRSLLGYDADDDDWVITTDGERDPPLPARRDAASWCTGTPRSTPTWTRCKKVMDHTDDLTHDQVVRPLLADLRSKGVNASPSRPIRSTTTPSSTR